MERMLDIDAGIEGPLNKCLFRKPSEDENHQRRTIRLGKNDVPGLVSSTVRVCAIYVLVGPTRKDGVCEVHGIEVLQEYRKGDVEMSSETEIDPDKLSDIVLKGVGEKVIKTLHCFWNGAKQSTPSSK